MLTLFSVPKPFRGTTAVIQRNAIRSWTALGQDVQVVLVGDEKGAAEVADEVGADHVTGLATNEHGTPRLDDAFERVDRIALHERRCFLNGDIVLLDDFLPAVRAVEELAPAALLVGRSIDLDVRDELDLSAPAGRAAVARAAGARGTRRGPAAMDYFVFPTALFESLPPFLVGRAGYDNWLVWRARQEGPVVDATEAIGAIHQAHTYEHVAGGKEEAYYGQEAAENVALAGGRSRIFTLHDASYRLTRDLRLRRNLGATFRMRETTRKVAWKLGVR
jgi:hypothetical protein